MPNTARKRSALHNVLAHGASDRDITVYMQSYMGSGNGLLPDGTKSLPEPMLTNHERCSVAFTKEQFHKRSGLGSIQFRNWNCSSIPIPELELKLVELKMELELKPLELELELELKTGIEFFAIATAALTS